MLSAILFTFALDERSRLLEYLDSKQLAREEIKTPDGGGGGGGSLIVVPAWGARIVGAFFEDGDNAFWTDPDGFSGGHRTWLGPETHDKGFFVTPDWKNWRSPRAMDPGDYRKIEPGIYANDCELTSNDGTKYHVLITRSIAPLAAPVSTGVNAIGIKFAHRLKNLGDRTIDKEIGLWSLIMMKSGGNVVIPISPVSDAAYRETYYEPVPKGRIAQGFEAITIDVNGPPRFKIGVHPQVCKGMIGSTVRLPDGRRQLVVKRFSWDAKGTYVDRPRGEPKSNGDPIQIYNHTQGGAKGFYEMECHAPAARLKPGEEQEHGVEIFVFRGPEDRIQSIASKILGVKLP